MILTSIDTEGLRYRKRKTYSLSHKMGNWIATIKTITSLYPTGTITHTGNYGTEVHWIMEIK